MENQAALNTPSTSYKEVRIGNTIYRVTSLPCGNAVFPYRFKYIH